MPNLDEREKFWNQEENRERERIQVEKERKRSEVKQLEAARKSREEAETKAREAMIRERERKISQVKDSETSAVGGAVNAEKDRWERQQEEDAAEELQRQRRGEEAKRQVSLGNFRGCSKKYHDFFQRNEEAKQLIGQRSTEARAVFERNSSVGQLNFRKQSNGFAAPPPAFSESTTSPTATRSPPTAASPTSPSPPPAPVSMGSPSPPPEVNIILFSSLPIS